MGNAQDFSSWRRQNRGLGSRFDYAHQFIHGHLSHVDAVAAVAEIIFPELRIVDGLVLVSELFSSEKLAELRSRELSSDEIEYWMNLFSVDGFLEGVPGASYERACGVAHVIAAAWTAKAQGLSPATTAAAWVIADQSSGDVCVTLSRSASAKPPSTGGAF